MTTLVVTMMPMMIMMMGMMMMIIMMTMVLDCVADVCGDDISCYDRIMRVGPFQKHFVTIGGRIGPGLKF